MSFLRQDQWSDKELLQLPRLLACGLGTITVAALLAKSHGDVLEKLATSGVPEEILSSKYLASPLDSVAIQLRKRSIHAGLASGANLGAVAKQHEMNILQLVNTVLSSNMLKRLSLDDVRGQVNIRLDEPQTSQNLKPSVMGTYSDQPKEHELSKTKNLEGAAGKGPINLHSLRSAWHEFRAEPKAEERLDEWLKQRQVSELFHFSPQENLHGILRMGLLTIRELKLSKASFRANDHDRFDETGGICTSMGFPNYKLLYRAQAEKSLAPVVLKVSAKAMAEIPWIAVPTNAAAAEMRKFLNDRGPELIGLEALTRMFVDEVKLVGSQPISRMKLGLPKSFPTDPQAEVIFLDRIPPYFIDSVCVPNDRYIDSVRKILLNEQPKIKIETRPDLYMSRMDYQFWSGGKRLRLNDL